MSPTWSMATTGAMNGAPTTCTLPSDDKGFVSSTQPNNTRKKGKWAMYQPPETTQVLKNKRESTNGTNQTSRVNKEKRVRLTQKAIVAAAASLFAERGFGSTSLEDIADVLGVT